MKPTSKAIELAPGIAGILKDLSQLQSQQLPFSPKKSKRIFKFSGLDAAIVVLLPPVLKKIQKIAPNVQLRTVHHDVQHLAGWLASGEIDLVAGTYSYLVKGIKRQLLFKTKYISVTRKENPRLSELSSLSGFSKERHVFVAPLSSSHFTRNAEDILASVIPKDNITASVPGFAAAGLLAKIIDAVVTIPRPIASVLARELNLATFEPPVKLPDIEVYQYWHERYDQDPGHEWLRAIFHEQCSRIADA
jgi:DNA-binding transcriptional LysR family regulator